MVCFQSILWGEESTRRLPGIIPAGYDSHTGYQYDSISRVAGHRELAPPSKFSKLGGFNRIVFSTSGILHPQRMFLPALIRILPRSGGTACPCFPVPRLPLLVYPTCELHPTTKSSLFSIRYKMPGAIHRMHHARELAHMGAIFASCDRRPRALIRLLRS